MGLRSRTHACDRRKPSGQPPRKDGGREREDWTRTAVHQQSSRETTDQKAILFTICLDVCVHSFSLLLLSTDAGIRFPSAALLPLTLSSLCACVWLEIARSEWESEGESE